MDSGTGQPMSAHRISFDDVWSDQTSAVVRDL